MSLIQYQQATYAGQLRDQLELAGCETRVAAIVSRAVGELIDHVSQAETGTRRDMEMRKLDAERPQARPVRSLHESSPCSC